MNKRQRKRAWSWTRISARSSDGRSHINGSWSRVKYPIWYPLYNYIGIGGMVGNKLFIDCILVLDTRKRKFGVMSWDQYREKMDAGEALLQKKTKLTPLGDAI